MQYRSLLTEKSGEKWKLLLPQVHVTRVSFGRVYILLTNNLEGYYDVEDEMETDGTGKFDSQGT